MSDFENRDVENQAAATAENGQPQQAPETPAAAPSPEPAPSPEAAGPSAYYATAPRLTLEPDLEPDLPLPRAPEPEPEPVKPQPPQWQAPPSPRAPRAEAPHIPEPPYNAYPGQQAPPQYQPPQYSQQPSYAQPSQPAYYPPQYTVPPMGYIQKSRLAAGLLAVLLGVFGVHNFYLGFKSRGAIQIIVALAGGLFTCGLATVGVVIWAFIEGVLILSASPSFIYDGNGVILRD